MSDNLNNLPESAFEIPNNIYKDALQPAAQEVGSVLKTITKTFNTLLIPLRLLNDTAEIKYRKFISDLEAKSHEIPPENICTPDLSTVGPALTDLVFSLDEEEIRSLYMNLLLHSIDNRTTKCNLRAFTQIIKQLSSFEAQLLKTIYESHSTCPVARVRVYCVPSLKFIGQHVPGVFFNDLITDICIDNSTEELCDLSLQNLLRLGLIELHENTFISPIERYSYVESSKTYLKAYKLLHTKNEDGQEFNKIDIERFSYSLSSFGESFCNICIA